MKICTVSNQFNYIHQFKIHNPSLFLIRKDGYPGDCKCNLLSWLSTEMDKNINNIVYFQQRINDNLYSYKLTVKISTFILKANMVQSMKYKDYIDL